MSNPRNPLDVFATYTYHFELHAAAAWEDLAQIQNTDQNATTTPTHKTNTTLINTRKDAHQIIDDVKFGYIGPSANNYGHYIPDGTMTLKVTEPNRVFFMEKIANTMKYYNVSSLSSLHWALKIFFIGRTPNNEIYKLPIGGTGIMVPMVFADMNSTFTYKGGEYMMNFVTLSSFGGSSGDKAMSSVMLAGYCNQNIPVTAKTVREALKTLEAKLNENYQNTYKVELTNPGIRPLVYKINIDSAIPDGTIDYATGNVSFAPNDDVTITFSASQTIVSWIFQILRSSTTLNSMVGDSLNHIRTQGHPGVKIISVFPTFLATKTELNIIYNIFLYQGENTEIQGLQNNANKNVMEFDFMFSSPGKNVDILGFDIHMKSALAWFSNNTMGSFDANTGQSATTAKSDPAGWQNRVVPTDVVQPNSKLINTERYLIPGGPGNDIAYLPAAAQADATGLVKYQEGAIKSAKLMFNTIAQMHGAFDPMFTITIRGHLDLLNAGIVYPVSAIGDLHQVPFGVRAPLWIKVNIKSPNDQTTPFFYNGLYNVVSIENHFSGGKFIQTVVVLMMGGMETPATIVSTENTNPAGSAILTPDQQRQVQTINRTPGLSIMQQKKALNSVNPNVFKL